MSSRASRSSGSCSCRPARAPTSARRSAAREARRSSARWARPRCSARSRARSPSSSRSPRSAWPCSAASAAAPSCARPRRPRPAHRLRGRRRPARPRLPRRRWVRGSVTRGALLARFALILALGLAGCGGEADSAVDHASPSEKPAYGDTLIEALTGNISGLIPNVLSDSASFEVGSLIYSGLVTRDRDLNVIGELAESWRFSKDCLDLTFHLRRDVLVANPGYFEGQPHISRVVYRIIPSQATIFLELKAKGVDSAGLTALQFKRQTEYPAFRKAYHKYEYPASAYTYLGFNLRDPRFADRRVRQAFAHAIDKREIIDGVLLGLGREATGPYKPGTWAYNPSVKTYPYDMDKARALLAEAGWTKNADGVLVNRHGQPFAFELLTNQGNDERKKVAEIVQASLKELGVQVDIRVIEWASFLKEYIKKRRFEAIILGWGIGLDPDQYEIWHSSKTGPDELNHVSYANPEVDALLEQGRQSCREEERKKSYARLQEILAEDQPIIFLYFRDALPVVSSRVRGIVPSPNGILYNFNKWYVPKHLQRYTAG